MAQNKQSTVAEPWRSNELLHTIADALPVLIGYIDPEARFRFNNKTYADWFGVVPKQLFGAYVRDVLGEESFERVRPHLEGALRGETTVFEGEFAFPGGKRFVHGTYVPHTDGMGKVLGVVTLISDLTERKRVEAESLQRVRELREKEELLRLVFERVDEYAIITFDANGLITSWNPGAQRVCGYSEHEAIGQHSALIFTPEDRAVDAPEREMERALQDKKSPDERWHMRKDGSRFWGSGFLVALRDEHGSLRGFAKILRDMTTQKRLQDALQQLNSDLEQRVQTRTADLQETNAQMEAFCYSVAHDLRAPLRAMQGFSQALLEDYAPAMDDLGRDYARRINASAQRMDRLIQDLLAYSRLSRAELRFENVSLSATVANALLSFEQEIRARGANVETTPDLPLVRAHAATLEQMIGNLISNALKFTARDRAPHIRISAEKHADRVRLLVRDNGIGIPPEHRERIFRIFERLYGAESFPGTGIGLAIVKKGAERMNAEVGLESQPNEGSTFWIDLPAAVAPK